jgi:ribonuclease Z
MHFEILILGSNAALPAFDRNPTSQIVHHHDRLFLIDCGEGTQKRFNDFKVKRSRLEVIFISHLHGDHVFGLPGLINSINLNGRTSRLLIFGPAGLRRFVETSLEISYAHINYELLIHEFDTELPQLIYENDELAVHSFPLKHRVPTAGYRFEEKLRLRKFKSELIPVYKISHEDIPGIKEGKDFTTSSGEIIPNNILTEDPPLTRSYAFCSDTIYDPGLLPFIKGVDLLYHEATFMSELKTQARERMHSTSAEAAEIASIAGVKKLLLGHFSSRYRDLSGLLNEAKAIFPESQLALEGHYYQVGNN